MKKYKFQFYEKNWHQQRGHKCVEADVRRAFRYFYKENDYAARDFIKEMKQNPGRYYRFTVLVFWVKKVSIV